MPPGPSRAPPVCGLISSYLFFYQEPKFHEKSYTGQIESSVRSRASMASSVARSLYRALLRTASRAIDGKRMHMLLAAPRNRSFDMIKGEFTALETSSRTTAHPADDIIHRAVYRLMNGSRLCVPIIERHGSFRDALSQSLRQALDREPSPSDDQALDHGFKLLRRLEEIASVGDSLQAPEDVNLDPLAPLRLQPCTLIGPEGPSPTSGSILARHPLLKRDVVMLLSAYDGWDGFAMGLVLNDPTDARVGATPLLASRGQTVARDASARDHDLPRIGELLRATAKGETVWEAMEQQQQQQQQQGEEGEEEEERTQPQSKPQSSGEAPQWTTGSRRLTDPLATRRRTRDNDLKVFANHIVHNGGPEGGANVTMLHPYAEVRGCVGVPNTQLFYGGDLQHAAELVRSGRARKEHFSFFRGRVDWRPGELRGEVELGEWSVASPVDGDGVVPDGPDGVDADGDDGACQAAVGHPLWPAGSTRTNRSAMWTHVVRSIAHASDATHCSWLELARLSRKQRERLLPGSTDV